MPSSRRFSFRLRTLLIAVTVCGVGLGWWLRPISIRAETTAELSSEFTYRRSLDGRAYYASVVTVRYPNGQLAAVGELQGIEKCRIDDVFGDEHFDYWLEDGTRCEDWAEWYTHLSHSRIHPPLSPHHKHYDKTELSQMVQEFRESLPLSEVHVSGIPIDPTL